MQKMLATLAASSMFALAMSPTMALANVNTDNHSSGKPQLISSTTHHGSQSFAPFGAVPVWNMLEPDGAVPVWGGIFAPNGAVPIWALKTNGAVPIWEPGASQLGQALSGSITGGILS